MNIETKVNQLADAKQAKAMCDARVKRLELEILSYFEERGTYEVGSYHVHVEEKLKRSLELEKIEEVRVQPR